MPTVHVVGRGPELTAIENFLDGAAGRQAVMLSGEPGIGKTTLWEAGVAGARGRGLRVLSARATEPELQLSFVALSDLFEEVESAELSKMPGPQLRALEIALLRAHPGGSPPGPFAASAGFTTALRILARRRPLLVAVDDVPWLDASSADALTFAARRLNGHRVRFLLARRPGEPSRLERAFGPVGLEHLEVLPLSLGATRSLLSERLGLTLPRRVLRRVFDSTGGSPLFALELGRLLLERGTPEIGAELPIPDLVDDLFGERVSGLPAAVRQAVLAVSLGGGLNRVELVTVVDPLAVEDAVNAGLLVVDGARVRVSHPLLAAAARKHSTARDRRELHLALARATADETRRAQHLALAAATPDAALARTVAVAAAAAIARGASHEAVEVAEQALRLTPPGEPEYPDRLIDLARYLVIAGEMQRAAGLLEGRAEQLPAGRHRSRAYLVLAECADSIDEELRCLEQALVESVDDPELQATALASKSIMRSVVQFRHLDEAEALALEALEAAEAAGPESERWALCALAWVHFARGRAVDDLSSRLPSPSEGSSLYETSIERVAGTRLVCRGEADEARALFQRLRGLAEERGEARSGWMMHHGLTEIELRAGNAEAAATLIAEAEEWTAFEDVHDIRAPRMAILEAIRGRPDDATRWAKQTIERHRATGMLREQLEGNRALGIVALLLHEPERAAEVLRPIWQHMAQEGIDEPGVWPMAADLVEALVELGELEESQTVTERLERLSLQQQHPWGRASAKRCKALIELASGYGEATGRLFLDAAEAYGALGLRFDQARTLLILGRAQRRVRKWAASRRSLDQAVVLFEQLGAVGWAEDARAELDRVGARRPAAKGQLTPAEERVVRLAADGLSNKEIAAALVVSVHTVERHLSHAYAKLGIHSRAQLARRLSDS